MGKCVIQLVFIREKTNACMISKSVQSPRLFWARIMLKWANKYLGIQRLQSWSDHGDSISFSMVVLGKKMSCQKVAPFLWNLPTFKKRTHQFWDPKASEAFPGGLCAKVLFQSIFYNHQAGQLWNLTYNLIIHIWLILIRWNVPKFNNFDISNKGVISELLQEMVSKKLTWKSVMQS